MLEKLVQHYPAHSNGLYRLAFAYVQQGKAEAACAHVKEAIRLSHIEHDSYHRAASQQHFERGQQFAQVQEYDLAINDFYKALDLNRQNQQATEAITQTTALRDG